MNKTIGCIGLGKMGSNMVLHLLEQGVNVVVYNRTVGVVGDLLQKVASGRSDTVIGQIHGTTTMAEFVAALPSPRIVFVMVTAGTAVDEVISQLMAAGLKAGDIVIDAGNCFYKDTIRRAMELSAQRITLIDCGTSGGLEGSRHGACLMLGGPADTVQQLSWLWDAVAVSQGWSYFGDHGAGHFVKMIHNGVEYGMNQAIAEGFAVLEKSPYQLDLAKIAENWNHGSVVRSWLMELLSRALKHDGKLSQYVGRVGGGETGKWTIETAKELGVPVEILTKSVVARTESLTKPSFAGKVVSALRYEYGGHPEPKDEK